MSSEVSSRFQEAVRFSRVMYLRWVVALGATISVGLGIFILLGQFAQVADRQTLGMPYLLLGIIAVPLILTYAERAAVIPGSGGAYNLARISDRVWLTYASGWLLLGGYASLVALLGWGVALHLNLLFEYFFNLSLDLSLLAVAIIGLVALNNLIGAGWSWRSRSTYIYVSIIFLLFIILRDLIQPAAVEQTTPRLYSTNRILDVTALMIASLWGLQFILNVRDEIQRPTRTLPQAMFLSVALGVGLGALAGLTITLYGAVPKTPTPLIEITSGFGLIPEVLIVTLYALFGCLISFIALNQGLVHGLRLIGDMSRDGFLPEKLRGYSGKRNMPAVLQVLFAIFSILLVDRLPILTLVGLVALIFSGVTALVHLPDAFRPKPNLPEKRFLKLPFHPLFPWLTMAIGIFLPFSLNLEVWLAGIVWVLIGGLYYVGYARQGGLAVRRQATVVGETTTIQPEAKAEYVVLVGIANPKTAPSLLRAGARLAQARDGQVLPLKVLCLAEQMPAHLKRQAAQEEWEQLAELVQQQGIEDVTVKPLIRLAPTPTAGILEAVQEEGVDLLLLGWEGERRPVERAAERETNLESILEPIIKHAPCDVAVLRGPLPQMVKRILVPTAGGPHAPVALALGQDLVDPDPDDRQILVQHMVADYLSPEREAEAKANLQATLDTSSNGHPIEPRLVEVDAVKEGILNQAEGADLLLIGASKEGFLEQSFFGGLPAEIASVSTTPTILARGREISGKFGLKPLLEWLTETLPTLTVARRAEVYQQMRESAQPSVDFFVLITLAATIASLGLLQNSAAVIIGAMLVAPLMSPILAMAMSMVQGDLRLLVVAAEATSKGIALAIMVGIVMVIISPIDTATTEILARTEPNILDLMVALASGAAAGYALGRKEVAAALPGVAIAAALVPPLCVVGYGIGTSQLGIAGGALLLFTTNLIAIILAAAITFLALGFHPARAERGELMRGLQITVISLAVVAIILGSATVTTVLQLNRRLRVEEIFKHEIVAQAAEVREMTIERDGNGFVINAAAITFEKNQLTPKQLTQLEEALSEAVGGPVEVNLTLLDGSRGELEGADRVLLLTETFEKELATRSAKVNDISVEEDKNGFTVIADVFSFEPDQLTNAVMTDIQTQLSEAVDAPVELQTAIIQGRRIDLEPVTPTPTAAPQTE